MRKIGKAKIGLLALSLLLVGVAAVGCGKDNHTHDYSSAWAFDAEAHWHPSTCSHDAKTGKSVHSYEVTVVPPTAASAGYTLHACACGYSYTDAPTSSLPVEGELRFDENGHWSPVLEGEVDVQPHDFTPAVVEPTCSTFGYTKHACDCGYWYATDTTKPTGHTVGGVLEYDETGHWYIARCCGAKVNHTSHNYSEVVTAAPTCDTAGEAHFACSDCGYVSSETVTIPAGHTYSDTLASDEYEHWRPATCGHEERTDVADHALIGRSNVCAVCGIVVSPRLAYALASGGEYYIVTGIGCWDSTDVTVPESYHNKPVREIAARAFIGEQLTSVTFEGNNLQFIGADAFAGTQISEVALPGSVQEIGTRAFANTAITALTLGESLQKLGNGVFKECALLETVTVNGSLATLPAYTFQNCPALTSFTYSGETTLAHVGAQAFEDCVKLTTIDLSACERVDFAAFAGCVKFAPANLPKLTTTEDYAFAECGAENVAMPMLQSVAGYLFSYCEKLTSVTLSATSVGAYAFEGCTRLNAVTLTNTQLIGAGAFTGCSALGAIELPDSVIRVGAGAFSGTNASLTTTQDGIKYVSKVVVGYTSGTTAISLKADTVGIADGALRGIAASTVTFTDSVRFIGVDAFRGNTALTSATFSASVRYVGANSFRESGLVNVTVPATVLSVGDNAFYDCKSLTTVSVSAKQIGKFAFSYTGVGRDLDHPVKQRPDYVKLTSVTLGEGVEVIGSNAFQYGKITSVALPATLKEIGGYAFAQTDITQITIPAAVTAIGQYAFYESKITSATFTDAQNWKAGTGSLNLSDPAQNAAYLLDTYKDYDWVKE